MSQATGVSAYPLQWPAGRPRTPAHRREKSPFRVQSIGAARDEVLREVRLLGGRRAVISSDLRLRNDGLPYADQRQPDDPGVAVYYLDAKGRQRCFACDRWRKVEENLRAVARTIDALRGVGRWGTGDMVEAAFTGFAALPARPCWWQVLGVKPDDPAEAVGAAYRRLSLERHPDRGGTTEAMAEVNRAWDEFRADRGEG